MKYFLKLFFVIVFVCLLTVSFFLGSKTSSAQLQTQNLGREIFISNCARCHGADGKSNTKLGRTLEAADLTSRGAKKLSVKKMTRIISRGDGAMPAFGKKLTTEQISAVMTFVRSL